MAGSITVSSFCSLPISVPLGPGLWLWSLGSRAHVLIWNSEQYDEESSFPRHVVMKTQEHSSPKQLHSGELSGPGLAQTDLHSYPQPESVQKSPVPTDESISILA